MDRYPPEGDASVCAYDHCLPSLAYGGYGPVSAEARQASITCSRFSPHTSSDVVRPGHANAMLVLLTTIDRFVVTDAVSPFRLGLEIPSNKLETIAVGPLLARLFGVWTREGRLPICSCSKHAFEMVCIHVGDLQIGSGKWKPFFWGPRLWLKEMSKS
jgi:hypothetical protein